MAIYREIAMVCPYCLRDLTSVNLSSSQQVTDKNLGKRVKHREECAKKHKNKTWWDRERDNYYANRLNIIKEDKHGK